MPQEVIQLTAMLTKCLMLLTEARTSKIYANKSLNMPVGEPRKELDQRTKEWLTAKNDEYIQQCDLLVCQAEKYLFPEVCDKQEQEKVTQELDEKSKKAIAYLLDKPAILDKLAQLADQQPDHENVKHPSAD